jgi:hypothetical protein
VRFDELILHIPGDEIDIAFHPHLTVLGGLGRADRQKVADGLVGALTGGQQESTLTFVDGTGRRVRAVCSAGTIFARDAYDSTAVETPLERLGRTADWLQRVVMPAADPHAPAPPLADEPQSSELAEVRAALEQLAEELEVAQEHHQRVEQQRATIEAVEREIVASQEGGDRRQYARVLGELDRVQIELTALAAGDDGEGEDGHLLAVSDAARSLIHGWTAARERLDRVRAELGVLGRVDADDVAAAAVPLEPPADLRVLLATVERARERGDLAPPQARREPTSTHGRTEDDDEVARLARTDQEALRRALDQVMAAERELDRARRGAAGNDDPDDPEALAEAVEAAHVALAEARAAANRTRRRGLLSAVVGAGAAAVGFALHPLAALVGLLVLTASLVSGLVAPESKVQMARRAERQALRAVGAKSYLGFHIRRMEVATDPARRARIDEAMEQYRMADAAWRALVGGRTSPARAAELLESASRERPRPVTTDPRDVLHIQCTAGVPDPALVATRSALLEVCATFRIDPAELDGDTKRFERLVQDQVAAGVRGRRLLPLHEAQADEAALARRVEGILDRLGYRNGDIEGRIVAVERAVERALARDAARRRGRTTAEVETDLVRLRHLEAQLRRPEWATVSPTEGEEPNVQEHERQLAILRRQLDELLSAGIDLRQVIERAEAMERRVSALTTGGEEAAFRLPASLTGEIQSRVSAWLDAAAAAGPDGDPLPVVLDEPFDMVGVERRWEMLDLLLRLAERHQLVYLTGDPFVVAWARKYAAEGALALVEPRRERTSGAPVG